MKRRFEDVPNVLQDILDTTLCIVGDLVDVLIELDQVVVPQRTFTDDVRSTLFKQLTPTPRYFKTKALG
ncbi:hypothetical protein D3C86_2014650 [compost metagenome]